MDRKQPDIVQLIERRRKRPVQAKARIMEEALAPDTTIARVAVLMRAKADTNNR